MSAWRREALARLPEYRKLIQVVECPLTLWGQLWQHFLEAAKADDRSAVRRILDYAAWCISEAAGPLPSEASNAAVCAF